MLIPEILYWLVVLINGAGLCAVLLWPRAKGKSWLVAFLAVILLEGLYFRVFQLIVRFSPAESRHELYDTFGPLHLLVTMCGVAANAFLVIALVKLRSCVGASRTGIGEQASGTVHANDFHLLPQTPPAVRARILLRNGVHSGSVAQELEKAGVNQQQAQSIVGSELESLRGKASLLFGVGLLVALIALVANVVSYAQYVKLQHSYGFHLVYFFPIPLLIGVVLICCGIARLRSLR